MVVATLVELDAWYNVVGLSIDRTNLLSKLATIELCGWLEGEFDRLIRIVGNGRVNDAQWIEEKVIKNTFGFQYEKHWRSMLCKVIGEVFAQRVEAAMEAAHPGDLEQLRSLLNQLSMDRNRFAHADLTANQAAMVTFNAPSLSINHHATLRAILGRYETVMVGVLATI
jgi:hypothetical protein